MKILPAGQVHFGKTSKNLHISRAYEYNIPLNRAPSVQQTIFKNQSLTLMTR